MNCSAVVGIDHTDHLSEVWKDGIRDKGDSETHTQGERMTRGGRNRELVDGDKPAGRETETDKRGQRDNEIRRKADRKARDTESRRERERARGPLSRVRTQALAM